MTEGQYSPVRLEQAWLVSSLLYGTQAMLVLKLPAFENRKYAAYYCFHGNNPYGEILIIRKNQMNQKACHIIMSSLSIPVCHC